MAQTVNVQIGNIVLQRKAKFRVNFDNDVTVLCVSAAHAVAAIKHHCGNDIVLSACDVYNSCSDRRGKKRLRTRWPFGVQIVKLRDNTSFGVGSHDSHESSASSSSDADDHGE